MNISDIKNLHLLWGKVYPYLAEQVMSNLPEKARMLMELGPFSGGISFELAKANKDYSIVIADRRKTVLDHLTREAKNLNLLGQIRLVQTELSALDFKEAAFDGVISRGAFFFLDRSTLKEICRVLRPGGIGFIGGGFGESTPRDLMDEIGPESRRLNKKLGRKWMSRTQLEEIIEEAELGKSFRIIEKGGLWVRLEK